MILTPAADELVVDIDLGAQRLTLRRGDDVIYSCLVSTAVNGPGELIDSQCTPCGWHTIHAKIGEGCPRNTVFVGRRPTGEVYSPELAATEPGRDWILTRIVWLEGAQPDRNRGGRVDTLQRYIYLHGCPDEIALGRPGSSGCIRMRNEDVLSLFEQVGVGARVLIHE